MGINNSAAMEDTIMATHITDATCMWSLNGEKKRMESPIARPKALARTGRETLDRAELTDSLLPMPRFRK